MLKTKNFELAYMNRSMVYMVPLRALNFLYGLFYGK